MFILFMIQAVSMWVYAELVQRVPDEPLARLAAELFLRCSIGGG